MKPYLEAGWACAGPVHVEVNLYAEHQLTTLLADAARYKWIRDHDSMSEIEHMLYVAQGDKAKIDAAIDAEIRKLK